MAEMSYFVSRVIQLDAVTLDDEFFKLIKGLIEKIFTKINLINFLKRYEAEFELSLKFIIWKFTIYDKHCTIGQKLLGVKYTSDTKKLRFLFLIEGIVPYLFKRIAQHLKIEGRVKWMDDIIKASQIINFCAFLIQNRYPTIASRLARLQFIPQYIRIHPSVGYSYQIRELLWHQFADFLMIILPLLNIHRIKGFFKNWRGNKIEEGNRKGEISQKITAKIERDKIAKCCCCKEDAVIPRRWSDCILCYYCLSANRINDSNFKCSGCPHSSNSRST